MDKNNKVELNTLIETFEVEELEERLEFAGCHWGNSGGAEGSIHEDDGNIGNCHD
ncbi:MAG: hypothetical protein V7780_03255 [Colwellia sp.]|jgi:hypothetical protein|uniref:hypothetical protein n=1 Tax=Colwellia sp. Bg11-12 TaxID=2759817 RepID=UPI0015F3CB37|nr:hypothetical protein [Colwellia sp. Bg11-12]MBA6264108.1 hypothetical protein [Colwellia sp. Bg11-12]